MKECPNFLLVVDLSSTSDPRGTSILSYIIALPIGSFLLQDQLEDPFLHAAKTEPYILQNNHKIDIHTFFIFHG